MSETARNGLFFGFIAVIVVGVIVLVIFAVFRSPRLSYTRVRTPDGRQVECVLYHAGYKGGLSCNWDHPLP